MSVSITNTVCEIKPKFNSFINIYILFDNLELDDFLLGMKLKDDKKGQVKMSTNAFKNSIQMVILLEKKYDVKIFDNGIIHICGIKENIESTIKIIMDKLLEKIFKIPKFLEIECEITKESLIKPKDSRFPHLNKYYIGKKDEEYILSAREFKDFIYLINPEVQKQKIEKVGKDEIYFYTKEHIRSRTKYNNLFEFSCDSKLIMENRKNLPKQGTFYQSDNKLYYINSCKDKKVNYFGQLVEYNFNFVKLKQGTVTLKVYFDCSYDCLIDYQWHISNTNWKINLKILEKFEKNLLYKILLDNSWNCEYIPDKYTAIKCNIYYDKKSGKFYQNEHSDLEKINVQFHGQNITGNCKDISSTFKFKDYLEKFLMDYEISNLNGSNEYSDDYSNDYSNEYSEKLQIDYYSQNITVFTLLELV